LTPCVVVDDLSTNPQRAGSDPRPSVPVLGFRERLELASAAVPWRVKLVVAYAAIGLVLVAAFLFAQFDLEWIREHAWNIVRRGLILTLLICIGAIALATVLATFGALARLSRNPVAYALAGFYTSFFRGTPLLVQIFLIYFALPEIGFRLQDAGYGALTELLVLSEINAGILALGLNYGAYMTEIFRAGIQSVGHGQGEAADALGMTYRQKTRRIVLPQAVRVIIPPTGNEFIAMLKDSALVSTIGATELFRSAELAGRADFRVLEALLIAAAMYWALTGIFSYFQSRLERRISRGYVRDDAARRRQPGPAPAGQPGIVAPATPTAGQPHGGPFPGSWS
jgi:polar amino acid transport system permease protein